MTNTVLVNGKAKSYIPIKDRGFQYGDGLFETIAIIKGIPIWWDRHLSRLLNGARRLNIKPPEEAKLRSETDRLVSGVTRGVLKIVLTRGSSDRGYAPNGAGAPTRVISISPWPDYSEVNAREGVNVRFCQTRIGLNPALAGIKHLNRLEQVLARAEWQDEFAEGLMLDVNGYVIEGTMSNLFTVTDGILYTPDLSECGVEGIARNIVLEQAKRISLPRRVARLTADNVCRAQEIFLTNSLIGLWPIKQLEKTEYHIGPITKTIRQAFEEIYNKEAEG